MEETTDVTVDNKEKKGMSTTEKQVITDNENFICEHLTKKAAFSKLLVAANLHKKIELDPWLLDLSLSFSKVFDPIKNYSSMTDLLRILRRSGNHKVYQKLLWTQTKYSKWAGIKSLVLTLGLPAWVLFLAGLIFVIVITYLEIIKLMSKDDWSWSDYGFSLLVSGKGFLISAAISYVIVLVYKGIYAEKQIIISMSETTQELPQPNEGQKLLNLPV